MSKDDFSPNPSHTRSSEEKNRATLPDSSPSLGSRTLAATAGIALSRISGILRAQVVNAVFGAGVALDAYNVAMRFPTVLRDLFAEGALSAAFTKSLMEARGHSLKAEKELTALVLGVFGLFTTALATVCVFFAKPFLSAITAEAFFRGPSGPLAVSCFAFLIFYLPIAMVSAVAMSLLGARGMTFRATIASLFFNVGSVLGALVGAPLFVAIGKEGVLGLAVGTLVGGALQCLYQMAPLLRRGEFPLPRLSMPGWRDVFSEHPLKSLLVLMFPRLIGQGALSLALFVNTHFATAAGTGAITYITNATNIILVPVGLFGVASGFASLPLLTQAALEKKEGEFVSLLKQGLQGTFWLSALSISSLALLSVPLCKMLLEHGKITPTDTLMNALAVCAYCYGIYFNASNKVLSQAYYALGDTRQIIINSLCYLACNATLSALLAPRFGILGLGISNCVSAAFDFALNFYYIEKVGRKKGMSFQIWKNHRRFCVEALALGIVALVCVFIGVNFLLPAYENFTHLYPAQFDWKIGFLVTVAGGAILLLLWSAAILRWGPAPLASKLAKLIKKTGVTSLLKI
jgi:putative peptidoglycan lipid II flippase